MRNPTFCDSFYCSCTTAKNGQKGLICVKLGVSPFIVLGFVYEWKGSYLPIQKM